MEKDDLKIIVLIIFWILFGVGLLTIASLEINYMVENVPLRITVDGREVYHGRSACVDTQSLGSSSRVDVKGGPWCLFSKEYFAGKDVVITTEAK